MLIVLIAQRPARERVFRRLKTHRDDIILDCGLQPEGPRIDALCERLRSDFAIRE